MYLTQPDVASALLTVSSKPSVQRAQALLATKDKAAIAAVDAGINPCPQSMHYL